MNPATLCPLCGEGNVVSRSEEVEQTYGGHRCQVPMFFRSCEHCGSDFAGAEESLMNRRAMMAFRKRVDGRMSGKAVVALRDKYRITQSQAARLFGGGPVSFSKYENDDVEQSEAMDTLLRLVEANESAFWTLVDQKQMRAEFLRTHTQPVVREQAKYSAKAVEGFAASSVIYEPREFRSFKHGRFEKGGVSNER